MLGKEVGILFYPNDYFVTFSLELDEFLRLLQLEALFGQAQHQQVPEAVELVETLLDVGRGEVTRLNHLQPLLIQCDDRVLVGDHLEERGWGWGWVEKEDESILLNCQRIQGFSTCTETVQNTV